MGISLEGSFVAENIVNELFGNKGMEWRGRTVS
jgi:hydrogenase maturation factor